MQIEFLGAAQTVTGSMHLVRTHSAAVLLDCGLYQGRRRESYERNRELSLPVPQLSALVLSHAHIDHSGALPILARHGHRGPIWATSATRDLCAVMLRDAANIMASDARTLTRQNARENRDDEVFPPLYDDDDVVDALERFRTLPYHQTVEIAPGVQLTFHDAGHVLGSAITVLDVEERGARRRIVFTGDLGRADRPILRDPEVPSATEVLITESTYGDRLHDAVEKMEENLASVVDRTIRRGGKLLIPSFALERAQELVLALKHLRARGQLPPVPVYIDSPLTIKITDAFKLHPECFDAETRSRFRSGDSPFDFPELQYVETVDESKAVTASKAPAIVIAASGMCEGGRILHHLRGAIGDPANTVLIVGFQAQHTLGRRLVERRDRVKIFGIERERRCEVVVLNGFSAHADQRDLLSYADRCRERGRLERIVLVHGDLGPQQTLAGLLRERGHAKIAIPAAGEVLSLL